MIPDIFLIFSKKNLVVASLRCIIYFHGEIRKMLPVTLSGPICSKLMMLLVNIVFKSV